MNVIVVGVDHSPGAKAALVFADEEARLRGATLRAVHAWQYGYIGYSGLEGSVPASVLTSTSCVPLPKLHSRRVYVRRCLILTSRSSCKRYRVRRRVCS